MKVQWFGNFQSINDLRTLHRQLIHYYGVSTQNYKIKVVIFKQFILQTHLEFTTCMTTESCSRVNVSPEKHIYCIEKVCSKE